MADNRVPREQQTRETAKREETWQPAQLLPEPAPRDGIAYRWIRVAIMGDADNMNASVRMREGWEPCKLSEHLEFTHLRDANSRFKDGIEIGGLLLCQCATEITDARKEYYEKSGQAQMESVDNNFMRENDPRMPLFAQRQSKITFGRGR